jgi:hypothetical protein
MTEIDIGDELFIDENVKTETNSDGSFILSGTIRNAGARRHISLIVALRDAAAAVLAAPYITIGYIEQGATVNWRTISIKAGFSDYVSIVFTPEIRDDAATKQ